MKPSHLLLISTVFIGTLVSSTLAHAITYNLSAVQTSFTSGTNFNGNPFALSTDGSNGSAITGSLNISGSSSLNAVLDLRIGTLSYNVAAYGNAGQLLVEGGSIFYGSNVYTDRYSDYGGYGSFYYEESYSYETISGITLPPAPATASGTGSLAAIVPAVINNLSVVTSVSDIILFGEETYTSYTYDDPSQTGTPTYSGYSYSYDREPFELVLTYSDATSGDLLLSETFLVSYTPVPVPAAGWLFASALGLFALRKAKH